MVNYSVKRKRNNRNNKKNNNIKKTKRNNKHKASSVTTPTRVQNNNIRYNRNIITPFKVAKGINRLTKESTPGAYNKMMNIYTQRPSGIISPTVNANAASNAMRNNRNRKNSRRYHNNYRRKQLTFNNDNNNKSFTGSDTTEPYN